MNDNQWINETDDLVTNPSPRIPICLCLDVSGSMHGEPIRALNEAIIQFYRDIDSDIQTASSCEIAVVTFDSNAELLEDFSLVAVKETQPLVARGTTNMHDGVQLALNVLNQRKNDYKQNGIEYYQPWLILMSDGHPNAPHSLIELQNTTKDLETNKKLMILPVGIGNSADLDVLGDFSNKRPGSFLLKGLKFKEFFNFISKSMESVSRSRPDENVQLPIELIKEWSDL